MDWAKTTVIRDENYSSFMIRCHLYYKIYGSMLWWYQSRGGLLFIYRPLVMHWHQCRSSNSSKHQRSIWFTWPGSIKHVGNETLQTFSGLSKLIYCQASHTDISFEFSYHIKHSSTGLVYLRDTKLETKASVNFPVCTGTKPSTAAVLTTKSHLWYNNIFDSNSTSKTFTSLKISSNLDALRVVK